MCHGSWAHALILEKSRGWIATRGIPDGVSVGLVQLEIHHLGDFQGQREVHVVEIHGHAIRIQETDTDLFQILRTRKDDFVGENRVAVVEEDALGRTFDEDLRQALNVVRGGLLFHCVEVVDGQEKVGISCRVDEGFRLEFVGAVHDIEGFLVAEMGSETEIIGAIFQADHDEGEAEGDGTVRRTGRATESSQLL